MAGNCSIVGIYNDLSSQLISQAGGVYYQYGVYIGLGSSFLNTSLWPSILHNETSFRTDDFCTTGSCSTGGAANASVPSGFQTDSSYKSLDDSSLYPDVTISHGTDSVDVWTNFFGGSPSIDVSVPDVPVTLVSNYDSEADHFLGPGDTLGLGPSSTILESLYSHDLISSRSYGLHVGSSTKGVTGLQNGSLVLGGYDAAGFSGQAYPYTLAQASATNNFSPFKVRVNQMTLQLGSGQLVDLTDQAGFDAYLTTAQYSVQFPRTVTQNLAAAIGAMPTTADDKTLRLPNDFDGNLTITLDNGFSTTFNSSWLSTTFGSTPISAAPLQNTTISTSNTTTITTTTAAEIPMLGLAFLQQVYLLVSHDNSPPSFWLAQANVKSDFFQQEPLCAGTTPQPSKSPNINGFLQQGLIGAVIGGVIGTTGLGFLIYFLTRSILRRRQGLKDHSDLEASSSSSKKQMSMRRSWSVVKRKGKSVKFRSKIASFVPITPVPPPKTPSSNVMVVAGQEEEENEERRSGSAASGSTASTKISFSNHQITDLSDAKKGDVYTETRELSFLAFRSHPMPTTLGLQWQHQQQQQRYQRQQQQPQQQQHHYHTHNENVHGTRPWVDDGVAHAGRRSSSMYSSGGEQTNFF